MFVRVKLMGILWILPYFSNAIDSGNLIFSMRLPYRDFSGNMWLKNIWYFQIISARKMGLAHAGLHVRETKGAASCEILFLEKFSGKIFFKNAVKRFRIF